MKFYFHKLKCKKLSLNNNLEKAAGESLLGWWSIYNLCRFPLTSFIDLILTKWIDLKKIIPQLDYSKNVKEV